MSGKFSIKNRIKGFGHALNGLVYFFKDTSNIPIYLLATAVVVALGFWVELDRNEWLWIVVGILSMYIAEIFNSSIEKVVDKASPEHSELAKHSKDMAAAGVLLTAVAATTIGLFIFIPHFL